MMKIAANCGVNHRDGSCDEEQRGQVSLLRPAAAHQSLSRAGHRTDGHSRTRNAMAMASSTFGIRPRSPNSRGAGSSPPTSSPRLCQHFVQVCRQRHHSSCSSRLAAFSLVNRQGRSREIAVRHFASTEFTPLGQAYETQLLNSQLTMHQVLSAGLVCTHILVSRTKPILVATMKNAPRGILRFNPVRVRQQSLGSPHCGAPQVRKWRSQRTPIGVPQRAMLAQWTRT